MRASFLLFALVLSGCSSPHMTHSTGHERAASYVIRGHRLEEKNGNDGERAMLILTDEHPSPVAHLHFWSDDAFDPKEKHWNRQVDLERCPACHPQYDLHFPVRSLEAVLRHLRQPNAAVRLTCIDDDWAIESSGSKLATVRLTR